LFPLLFSSSGIILFNRYVSENKRNALGLLVGGVVISLIAACINGFGLLVFIGFFNLILLFAYFNFKYGQKYSKIRENKFREQSNTEKERQRKYLEHLKSERMKQE